MVLLTKWKKCNSYRNDNDINISGKVGKVDSADSKKDNNKDKEDDVELSEVSDKEEGDEIKETRQVRMKDPSMSPIESDASDSYNKV